MIRKVKAGKENTARRLVKIILGFLGVIIVSALGSGFWDLFFRPGFGVIGHFIISLSSTLDNAVLSTAALDPRPLSGLLTLLVITQVPLLMVMWFIAKGFLFPILDRAFTKRFDALEDNEFEVKASRDLRVIYLSGAILSILFYIPVMIGMHINNEATMIWREYHRNVAICAQYMTIDQGKMLNSEFSAMQTRANFKNIQKYMNNIAVSHSIILKWEGEE